MRQEEISPKGLCFGLPCLESQGQQLRPWLDLEGENHASPGPSCLQPRGEGNGVLMWCHLSPG